MAEKEKVREREREAMERNNYEAAVAGIGKERERSMLGQLLIRGEELEWEVSRQGRIKFYLNPYMIEDSALQSWFCFVHDIKTQSGKHRHQGGLVLFVLEGKGYTVVDGEKVEWEEGDLILLPLKPDGVTHQHFNLDPDKSSKWLAFIYLPWFLEAASELTQLEVSPNYKPS